MPHILTLWGLYKGAVILTERGETGEEAVGPGCLWFAFGEYLIPEPLFCDLRVAACHLMGPSSDGGELGPSGEHFSF